MLYQYITKYGGGGDREGTQQITNFYTGKLHQEVQPLTLL